VARPAGRQAEDTGGRPEPAAGKADACPLTGPGRAVGRTRETGKDAAPPPGGASAGHGPRRAGAGTPHLHQPRRAVGRSCGTGRHPRAGAPPAPPRFTRAKHRRPEPACARDRSPKGGDGARPRLRARPRARSRACAGRANAQPRRHARYRGWGNGFVLKVSRMLNLRCCFSSTSQGFSSMEKNHGMLSVPRAPGGL
jgi:hypothetical protein